MHGETLNIIASESLLGYGRTSLSEGRGEGRDVGIEKVVDGGGDVLLVISIASDSANLLNDNATEAYRRCQDKSIECGKINAFAGYLGHG